METYVNERFSHETIDLDGKRFERCTFDDCKLRFSAIRPVQFHRCSFTNSDWVFAGPAETMLYFLSDLYHGLGVGGRSVVELMIRGIKDGTFPETLASSHALSA